jgi:ribosomal-protein-alanine N-acetyltransferase
MLDLRALGAGDADHLHGLLGDPALARWLRPSGVTGAFTLEECERLVTEDVAHWTAHGFGPWLAFENGECVGRALLKHAIVAGRGELEVGWTVARRHCGRGLGTTLARYALSAAAARGIDDVVAFTRVDNHASRRVIEKVDLRREQEFLHVGLPHVLYRSRPSPPSPSA